MDKKHYQHQLYLTIKERQKLEAELKADIKIFLYLSFIMPFIISPISYLVHGNLSIEESLIILGLAFIGYALVGACYCLGIKKQTTNKQKQIDKYYQDLKNIRENELENNINLNNILDNN